MEPVLFEIGGVAVRGYGLLSGLGVAAGLVVVLGTGLRAGLDRKRLVDVALWALVGGLVGSKLLLVLLDAREYAADPWAWVDLLGAPHRIPRILLLWQGGLVYYGGILGGAVAAAIYCRARRIDLAGAADAIAPGLSVGHVWGRLGCLFAGCCFGKAGGGGLGVPFGPGSQAYEAHAALGLLPPPYDATYPLHPTQLYESAAELFIAGALLWLGPRRRYRGQVALAYLASYSLARFGLEMLRGDRARGFVGDPVALVGLNHLLGVDGGSPSLLSVSQLAAAVTLLVCGWSWLLMRHARTRRDRRGGGLRP